MSRSSPTRRAKPASKRSNARPTRAAATAEHRGARFDETLQEARVVLDKEIAGLVAVRQRLGASFVDAVDLLERCGGRVIVAGVGKSGIVAKKIAATLTSTGTRSMYLHPVEAAHGDMGILAPEDVLLVVSYSGANEEFEELLSAAARMRIPMLVLTGNASSWIARSSQLVIDCRVPEEACPLNLAPTASTTAALAVGDALAIALLKRRDFGVEHFALTHPSGVLGRRLNLTVREIMKVGDELPCVLPDTTLRNALFVIMEKRLGCVFVVDAHAKLLGIITDGDLKRILVRDPQALEGPVHAVMVAEPRRIASDAAVVEALRDMEENPGGAITQLAVVDPDGRLEGAVHMHDIVRVGLSTAPPP
jgi:arabinose-5-phosphate isomerase